MVTLGEEGKSLEHVSHENTSLASPSPPPLSERRESKGNCFGQEREKEMQSSGEPPLKRRSTGPTFFYAVRVGRSDTPCVLTSWDLCRAEVDGVSGAIFKKFRTRGEAAAFAGCEAAPSPAPAAPAPGGSKSAGVVVFTDGACPGQHTGDKEARRAGCGVWFGHGDERNISVPNPYEPHTSNRAEMAAALLAMRAHRRSAREGEPLRVMSDSTYVVKGMNEWMTGWERRQWRNVKNPDLWKKLSAERKRALRAVAFVHVRGHNGDEGNEEADRLAREGAQGRAGTGGESSSSASSPS